MSEKKIPIDGTFWPVYPSWYYEKQVMKHLKGIKERLLQKKISTDLTKMLYDAVMHRLLHMKNVGMTHKQQQVWSTYGKTMLNHKINCDWVEMILEEGCVSCSYVM